MLLARVILVGLAALGALACLVVLAGANGRR